MAMIRTIMTMMATMMATMITNRIFVFGILCSTPVKVVWTITSIPSQSLLLRENNPASARYWEHSMRTLCSKVGEMGWMDGWMALYYSCSGTVTTTSSVHLSPHYDLHTHLRVQGRMPERGWRWSMTWETDAQHEGSGRASVRGGMDETTHRQDSRYVVSVLFLVTHVSDLEATAGLHTYLH